MTYRQTPILSDQAIRYLGAIAALVQLGMALPADGVVGPSTWVRLSGTDLGHGCSSRLLVD